MSVFRLTGKILPPFIQITMMGHPTLNWRDVTGLLKAKFDLAVQNNEVTISVETEKSDAESVQQSMIRPLDMADSTISLISFRESIGLTVVIDKIHFEERTEDVYAPESPRGPPPVKPRLVQTDPLPEKPLKMSLKLRPPGLGSGIDKDRPDYTVYCGPLSAISCLGAFRTPAARARG
jgi:hypothetical protein